MQKTFRETFSDIPLKNKQTKKNLPEPKEIKFLFVLVAVFVSLPAPSRPLLSQPFNLMQKVGLSTWSPSSGGPQDNPEATFGYQVAALRLTSDDSPHLSLNKKLKHLANICCSGPTAGRLMPCSSGLPTDGHAFSELLFFWQFKWLFLPQVLLDLHQDYLQVPM